VEHRQHDEHAGNQTVDNRASQNSTSWERGNNYVLFEDVVPDASGNITVNGYAITEQPTYDIRLAFNGFQLWNPLRSSRVLWTMPCQR
jgi:hypothetical protein